ncbi:Unknown protein sequence [Pseudomonas syringae pv. tagetis]|uniref:Uncharacterized protein n=1 Tax=Pseudomonas syringae pv. tagetis TaxID=129140 RepID=A0A0Q0B039_9PSED|nr:Unknown protein sequence [Pseudomonas syringae pv. tagetis]RMQ99895.1 hypothetical protein ALP93_05438 [Pseudomonas syringae pv. helianthi]RMW16908.1 hypothetical protein ALO98_05363 [Pseudomonas syringae pv. tagetis]
MGMCLKDSRPAEHIKQVRLADQIQRSFVVHGHAFGLWHAPAQAHVAFFQRTTANRPASGIEFQDAFRLIGQRQQVAARLIELQTGQIAHGKLAITFAVSDHLEITRCIGIDSGKAAHLDDLHRIALAGDKQALAARVIGQTFVAFIATGRQPQRQLLGIGGVQTFGVVIHMNLNQPQLTLITDDVNAGADVFNGLCIAKPHQRNTSQHTTIQAEFDQFRILVGHREQALAVRVVAQARDIILKPLDNLLFCHSTILIKTNGLKRVGLPEHLPVEQYALHVAVALIGAHEQHNQRNKDDKQE